MTLMLGSGDPRGALSAERVTELTSLLTKGALCQEGETSPLAVLTALANIAWIARYCPSTRGLSN